METKHQNEVLNIGHRGARAFAPENTLVAFTKAKSLGCAMVEIDVHRAKDGELIVHHDDQLTRCTDVAEKFPGRSSYFLSDFKLEELAQLDAGSWFAKELLLPQKQRQPFLQPLTGVEIERHISSQELKIYASGDIKLPTLREVLELALHSGLMVNIEIKTLPRMYPDIADAVVGLVEKMSMQEQILISSFDHEQLQRVRQLSKKLSTGVLSSDRLVNPVAYISTLDANAYHPCLDSLGLCSVGGKLDASRIKNIRGAGFGVNVWTVNEKSAMTQLIEAGVSGLISDYPNRVQEVLAQ